MRKTYKCADGREVLLRFDKDALKASVITTDGAYAGELKFELSDAKGNSLSLEDPGAPASVKLAEAHVFGTWTGQGIEEYALRLFADEIGLPAAPRV